MIGAWPMHRVGAEAAMEAFRKDEVPIAIDTSGVQIRARQLGDMTMLFYRFEPGADLRPELRGLPGDRCTCPHWGYVISGKLRIHTQDGEHDVGAGEAFYVEPGHYPEALELTEMVEVSPTKEILGVGEHILRVLGMAQRRSA